jgi:putative ABC transport system permease protein
MRYEVISLVSRNLLRSKRRTLLTILSVAVSLLIFAALTSLPSFADRMLADNTSSLRIGSRTKMGLDYPLPEAYKSKIAALPHVVGVVPCIFFNGIYHEVSDQFPNIAVDPEQIDSMFPDWGFDPTGVQQFKKIKTAVLVSEATMRRFNLHLGQQIELRGSSFPFNVQLSVVGTFSRGPAPNLMIFRRDYFEEAAGRPGIAHMFWVRVDDASAVPAVTAAIDRQFANSFAETQSDAESVFLAQGVNRFRIFMQIAEFLGVVVVVAIGLVAANTAAMAIRERRSEIAVMRAIGYPVRTILTLLFSESLAISLLGCIIGCGGGLLLLKAFSVNADALGPFVKIGIPPTVLAETFGVAILIGLFSVWIPARAATRRPIVDSLRVVD